MAECEIEKEKGFKQLTNDKGEFVCNAMEYNGHLYTPFGDNLVDRLDSYRQSFPVYDSDIYLLTYPKSGTHWVWEILMMLTHTSADYRQEHKHDMMIEIGSPNLLLPPNADSRRIINTHLIVADIPPAILTNMRGKIIQVHRNPADVAVSFYSHLKKEVKGAALACGWDDFLSELYYNKKKMPHSSWFDYTSRWWSQCHGREDYLPVFYEELKQNPMKSIGDIAEFIGVKADKDLIERIATQTSFTKMKEGKKAKEAEFLAEYFADGYSMYRKGEVGDWKNSFSKSQHNQLMRVFNDELKDLPELRERLHSYIEW